MLYNPPIADEHFEAMEKLETLGLSEGAVLERSVDG